MAAFGGAPAFSGFNADTDTPSSTYRESSGLGVANLAASLLAGLPAHFWDITAVNALDKVYQRLRKHGSPVEVVGLNEHGRALVSKLDLGIE